MVNYDEDLATVMNAKDYKPTGRGPYEQRSVVTRTLGRGGSSSRMIRRISS
jgi:hypothetical protein